MEKTSVSISSLDTRRLWYFQVASVGAEMLDLAGVPEDLWQWHKTNDKSYKCILGEKGPRYVTTR